MSFPAPGIDAIVLKGGLDLITPTLSLPSGYLRQCLNFEAAVAGGYTRVKGYERFDGRPSPTDMSLSNAQKYLSVTTLVNSPTLASTINGTGGASGKVAYVDGLIIVIAKSTGTWLVGDTLTVGATTIGVVDNVTAGPISPRQDAKAKNAMADIYRADITAVPGKGSIRGVFEFNDVVYVFRDNNATPSTSCDLYKSSTGGWTQVPYYKTVSFTAGGTATPADGATLTKGGVTATIKRVVRTSGSWQAGTAAGQFIITTPAGGNFSAGAATAGAVPVTLSGAQTSVSMLPGGRYQFDEHNFGGQAGSNRVYGCDGVNKAFEFDGDVLVPISTGTTTDTPTNVVAHKGYLFLSIGSSEMQSAPGLPYDYTAINGAAEIAVGDTITGHIVMPGGTNSATLCICSRINTFILYGNGPSNWNLVAYNTGTGAIPYSLQNMAQTFAFDDRGINSIQTSLQYGNFTQSTLSNAVLPFINDRINSVTASVLCRRKSQYRAFFSDGYGIYITVVNGKSLGCAAVFFYDPVLCTYEGKKSTGEDIMYFGSDNGFVYQMEKGTSFDGEPIEFFFTNNYSNARSPRTLKRYRKAVPEISSDTGAYVEFSFAHLLGYESASYPQPPVIDYSSYMGMTRWDQFTWDNFFWDGTPSVPLECLLDGTAENIAIQIAGSYDYIPSFTINSILVHYSPRRLMR